MTEPVAIGPDETAIENSGAMFAGRFITFEGGEGAGKSLQIGLLAERLRGMGLDVALTREPGGSPGAERIRALLLEGGAAPLDPFAAALMFFAARQDHLATTIRPALALGAVVLCDRFVDSTLAYQGVAGHVPKDVLSKLSALVIGTTMPDATIIIDIDPEIGLTRAEARRNIGQADRFEAESLSFHRSIRQAFLDIARNEPERCRVVSGDVAPDMVERSVWASLQAILAQTEALV